MERVEISMDTDIKDRIIDIGRKLEDFLEEKEFEKSDVVNLRVRNWYSNEVLNYEFRKLDYSIGVSVEGVLHNVYQKNGETYVKLY